MHRAKWRGRVDLVILLEVSKQLLIVLDKVAVRSASWEPAVFRRPSAAVVNIRPGSGAVVKILNVGTRG
jgi:hypothetical protein